MSTPPQATVRAQPRLSSVYGRVFAKIFAQRTLYSLLLSSAGLLAVLVLLDAARTSGAAASRQQWV